MKRHPHLQPLSRQHHNGLLMALLLKKGIAKGASACLMNSFIVRNWEEELSKHFNMEEKLLLPELENTAFKKERVAQLLYEHETIRSLVAKAAEGSAGLTDITEFHTILDKHIRFEEKIFFPEAEAVLSPEQLAAIGNQLEEDLTKNCLQYPVKFWE